MATAKLAKIMNSCPVVELSQHAETIIFAKIIFGVTLGMTPQLCSRMNVINQGIEDGSHKAISNSGIDDLSKGKGEHWINSRHTIHNPAKDNHIRRWLFSEA